MSTSGELPQFPPEQPGVPGSFNGAFESLVTGTEWEHNDDLKQWMNENSAVSRPTTQGPAAPVAEIPWATPLQTPVSQAVRQPQVRSVPSRPRPNVVIADSLMTAAEQFGTFANTSSNDLRHVHVSEQSPSISPIVMTERPREASVSVRPIETTTERPGILAQQESQSTGDDPDMPDWLKGMLEDAEAKQQAEEQQPLNEKVDIPVSVPMATMPVPTSPLSRNLVPKRPVRVTSVEPDTEQLAHKKPHRNALLGTEPSDSQAQEQGTDTPASVPVVVAAAPFLPPKLRSPLNIPRRPNAPSAIVSRNVPIETEVIDPQADIAEIDTPVHPDFSESDIDGEELDVYAQGHTRPVGGHGNSLLVHRGSTPVVAPGQNGSSALAPATTAANTARQRYETTRDIAAEVIATQERGHVGGAQGRVEQTVRNVSGMFGGAGQRLGDWLYRHNDAARLELDDALTSHEHELLVDAEAEHPGDYAAQIEFIQDKQGELYDKVFEEKARLENESRQRGGIHKLLTNRFVVTGAVVVASVGLGALSAVTGNTVQAHLPELPMDPSTLWMIRGVVTAAVAGVTGWVGGGKVQEAHIADGPVISEGTRRQNAAQGLDDEYMADSEVAAKELRPVIEAAQQAPTQEEVAHLAGQITRMAGERVDNFVEDNRADILMSRAIGATAMTAGSLIGFEGASAIQSWIMQHSSVAPSHSVPTTPATHTPPHNPKPTPTTQPTQTPTTGSGTEQGGGVSGGPTHNPSNPNIDTTQVPYTVAQQVAHAHGLTPMQVVEQTIDKLNALGHNHEWGLTTVNGVEYVTRTVHGVTHIVNPDDQHLFDLDILKFFG